MNHNRAFTLIELLVSVVIFTLISTASYKLFKSVTQAHAITSSELKKVEQIQIMLSILEKDLFQTISRSIKNQYGDTLAALQAPTEKHLIEFTKIGWRNPLKEKRSNLQRVAYQLEENKLIRLYWTTLDQGADPSAHSQIIIDNITSLSFLFLNSKKKWTTSWPETNHQFNPYKKIDNNNDIPEAIKINLKHKELGSFTMLIPTKKERSFNSKKNQPQLNNTNESGFL